MRTCCAGASAPWRGRTLSLLPLQACCMAGEPRRACTRRLISGAPGRKISMALAVPPALLPELLSCTRRRGLILLLPQRRFLCAHFAHLNFSSAVQQYLQLRTPEGQWMPEGWNVNYLLAKYMADKSFHQVIVEETFIDSSQRAFRLLTIVSRITPHCNTQSSKAMLLGCLHSRNLPSQAF